MKQPNKTGSRSQEQKLSLLIALFMLTLAFGLAAKLGPQLELRLVANGEAEDDPAAHWLGDSRRLFANSFFVKADAYFHSGYYPTIYDNNAPFKTPHIGEDSGTMESKNTGDETTIFSHPHNWVERFQLNFFPSYHTHLDQGGVDGNGASEVKEIMPWLKLSAELDQNHIQTYLVAAYWLRVRMHKDKEAEEFLREGIRANPGNPDLLFELGQLYEENRHDPSHARNLYLAALKCWHKQNDDVEKPDKFIADHIFSALAKLEQNEGNISQAIGYLELLKTVSPSPASIQNQIDELEHNPPQNHERTSTN